MIDFQDTIAAIASPPAAAVRGIVRLSGNDCLALVQSFVSMPASARKVPFRCPGSLHLGGSDGVNVAVDVHVWPTRRSYTGQPIVELHTNGSPPLLDAVLDRALQAGARPARPGEFTLRAFLAGRIDLPQAEAVLGVIDAETQAELETSLQQLAGGLSETLRQSRSKLVELLADLEAGLDFAEEEGIAFVTSEEVAVRLRDVKAELRRIESNARRASQVVAARRVVIAGFPNAGKSRLFNRLTEERAALVSNQAGTTRDYLKRRITLATEIGEAEVELIDTAGWDDESTGPDHRAQVARDEQSSRADLILWCTPSDESQNNLLESARRLSRLKAAAQPIIHVATKSDVREPDFDHDVSCSAESGQGVRALINAIVESTCRPHGGGQQVLGSTAARCHDALRLAADRLSVAEAANASGADVELIAIDVREAIDALGAILGLVYTDDILDRIFSKFCIGK